jgi:hypothetical protein
VLVSDTVLLFHGGNWIVAAKKPVVFLVPRNDGFVKITVSSMNYYTYMQETVTRPKSLLCSKVFHSTLPQNEPEYPHFLLFILRCASPTKTNGSYEEDRSPRERERERERCIWVQIFRAWEINKYSLLMGGGIMTPSSINEINKFIISFRRLLFWMIIRLCEVRNVIICVDFLVINP